MLSFSTFFFFLLFFFYFYAENYNYFIIFSFDEWVFLSNYLSEKLRLYFNTPETRTVSVHVCIDLFVERIWTRACVCGAISCIYNVPSVWTQKCCNLRFHWHRFTADELINYVNVLLNYYYANGLVTVISDYNFTWNLRYATDWRCAQSTNQSYAHGIYEAWQWRIHCAAALAWPRICQH